MVFFSVLIPTRDRPELLKSAIKSVIGQTYKNFELIVSDNSTKEEYLSANKNVIEPFAHMSNFRYIKPQSNLNMPDHWEFASLYTTGKYVLILTDRHVMRPDALKFIQTSIDKHKDPPVIIWHYGSCFHTNSRQLETQPFSGKETMLNSREILKDFAKFPSFLPAGTNKGTSPLNKDSNSHLFTDSKGNDLKMPRTLNSCYSSDLATIIRGKYDRFFHPTSPDMTAGFLQLATARNILYLDRPPYVNHGGEVGNGRGSIVHGITRLQHLFPDTDMFQHTPIQIDTLFNNIVSDFISMMKKTKTFEDNIPMDIVGYFMGNYQELILKERFGSSMDVSNLYNRWWSEVRLLSESQQQMIMKGTSELDRARPKWTMLRKYVVSLKLERYYFHGKGRVNQLRAFIKQRPFYSNALEAAQKTNWFLWDA